MIGYVGVEEQVDKDFHRARRRAFIHRLRDRLRRDLAHERLVSFDEAKGALVQWSQSYRGMRTVDVEKIAGSVGRCKDFDESFLPLKVSMARRWERVDRAYHQGVELPAVSLYKIGETYFVRDGNHRVSVAKFHGVAVIDAEVVEIRGRARTDVASHPTREPNMEASGYGLQASGIRGCWRDARCRVRPRVGLLRRSREEIEHELLRRLRPPHHPRAQRGATLLLDFLTSEVTLWPSTEGLRPPAVLTVPTGVLSLAYPTVGALIAVRLPTNPIGWIFCGVGLLYGAQRFTAAYADYALLESFAFPGGNYVAWFSICLWLAGLAMGVFLILWFPDGRLPSRRWRIVTWVAISGTALTVLGFALYPDYLIVTHPYVDNPFGVVGVIGGGYTSYELFGALRPIGMALLLTSSLVAPVTLVLRLRRAEGNERQQLKWFLFAAAPLTAFLGLIELDLLIGTFTHDFMPQTLDILQELQVLTPVLYATGFAVLFVPIFTYIAIVRYRLYDIDVVINRTLVYGALTILVVGIYVVAVGTLGALFQARGDLGVSLLATGLVAVIFQPLRGRLQRDVNRLMYGERDDPYAVTSRLGRRLEAALAPETVLSTIAETIAQALKLPYTAILLKEGEGFRSAAAYGSPEGEPETLSPYDNYFATLGLEEFKKMLERRVDFRGVRVQPEGSYPALLVGAVDVLTGEFRAFNSRRDRISAETILASAAIPTLFRSVRLDDGGTYWDGLFSQNPPVRELTDEDPDEIWVIQINPRERETVPKTVAEIADRRNELSGNLSLHQELGFIEKIDQMLEAGHIVRDGKYKQIVVRVIELSGSRFSDFLGTSSKLNRDPRFIRSLMAHGKARAEELLTALAFENAWKSRDPAAVMAFFADDAQIVSSAPFSNPGIHKGGREVGSFVADYLARDVRVDPTRKQIARNGVAWRVRAGTEPANRVQGVAEAEFRGREVKLLRLASRH